MKLSDELLSSFHPLEIKVIPYLKDGIKQTELVQISGLQDAEVTRALQWLENKKAITTDQTIQQEVSLDSNGKLAVEKGMPETRFLLAARGGAKTNDDMAKTGLSPQEIGVSIGILKKEGLIEIAQDNSIIVTKKGMVHDTNLDDMLGLLRKLAKAPQQKFSQKENDAITKLKQRKNYVHIKEHKDRTIRLTELGKELLKADLASISFADRVTPEDVASGAWKEKRYRSYDVSLPAPRLHGGKEHFIQEAIDFVNSIWIDMGFTEHEGAMVQTAFWDLDALFVPQDHPARDTQDTFYLENPTTATVDKTVFDRVKAAHENGGGTGSKGWRYSYSRDEAQKLMLRTHDTVLSAQTLAAIRTGQAKMPGKYFTVSRVFRNEKADWKHLFEFHQVGGIVIDRNANFAQLITYLKTFFAKMGFPKIRLRPHHFPYTEPSVEVDVWNPRKQQWVELGGAGVFRPEVTKTLIGEEVPVLAWGLGLERIIVEYFGLTDLRDLYRNDIKQLREMKRFIKLGE